MQDETIHYIFTNNVKFQYNAMQYFTTLYNTIQISLHCNVIQYPVILNNAIEHTKYPAIQQNTIQYNRILPLLSVK